MREGRIRIPADVDAAVIEGASARVRPLLMTVATTVLGLLPLLWESGVGADVSARTAAPVVGSVQKNNRPAATLIHIAPRM